MVPTEKLREVAGHCWLRHRISSLDLSTRPPVVFWCLIKIRKGIPSRTWRSLPHGWLWWLEGKSVIKGCDSHISMVRVDLIHGSTDVTKRSTAMKGEWDPRMPPLKAQIVENGQESINKHTHPAALPLSFYWTHESRGNNVFLMKMTELKMMWKAAHLT